MRNNRPYNPLLLDAHWEDIAEIHDLRASMLEDDGMDSYDVWCLRLDAERHRARAQSTRAYTARCGEAMRHSKPSPPQVPPSPTMVAVRAAMREKQQRAVARFCGGGT